MVMSNFGLTIRSARKGLGVTQARLAKTAGLQQPAIVAIESGKRMPRRKTVKKLLAALKSHAAKTAKLAAYIQTLEVTEVQFKIAS